MDSWVFLRPVTRQLEEIYMSLDTFQSHRDRAKLKWWYKLDKLPRDWYSKQQFN